MPRQPQLGVFLRGSRGGSAKALRDAAKGGFQEIIAAFHEFCAEMEDGILPEVMYDALEPTFELSQVRVPVDTGELKDSGYLDITHRGKNPVVEIGYGRGGAPYAIYVHEMPHYHKPPTTYKYLQGPLDEDYIQILNRIIAGTRVAMNG